MDHYYNDVLPSTSGISLHVEANTGDDCYTNNICKRVEPPCGLINSSDRRGYLHTEDVDTDDSDDESEGMSNELNETRFEDDAAGYVGEPLLDPDFTCNVCGDRFSNKTLLKNHARRHKSRRSENAGRNDPPLVRGLYRCELCDKEFSHRANVTIHMRVHSKERPFPCEKCGKSFTQLGNLQTHMHIHEDLKPFACDVCLRAFTQAGNAKKHRNTRHVAPSLQCGVCKENFSTMTKLSIHATGHRVEGLVDKVPESAKKRRRKSTTDTKRCDSPIRETRDESPVPSTSRVAPAFFPRGESQETHQPTNQHSQSNFMTHGEFFHAHSIRPHPVRLFCDMNNVADEQFSRNYPMFVPPQ